LNILQICPRVPYPPDDGMGIAMFDVINHLTKNGHKVTVLAINTPKHFQPDNVLEGIALLKTVFVNTNISAFKAFLNLFKKIPYNIERFISEKFKNILIQLLQSEEFDVIQIEGTFVAWYVDIIKKNTNIPVILRSHNLEYQIWKRLAYNEKNILKKWYLGKLARGVKDFEREYLNKFDAIAAITENDKQSMRQLSCTTPIEYIPAGVELERLKNNDNIKPKPNSIFILGALNWMPNLEALEWFLEHIWPVVHKDLPEITLHIAGKDTPDYLFKLNLENVHVHGFVDSASDFIQQYDLMLVPLLSGGGMRIKIIEGMALSKCIVSTSLGAEGIDCENDRNILICNTPQEWIDTIANYFKDTSPGLLIGKNARQLINQKYKNEIVIKKFINLYKELTIDNRHYPTSNI